jgi:hypothetical protein
MAFCYYVENNYIDIFDNFTLYVKGLQTNINIDSLLLNAYPRFGNKTVQYFNSRKDVVNLSSYCEEDDFSDFEDSSTTKSINNTTLML